MSLLEKLRPDNILGYYLMHNGLYSLTTFILIVNSELQSSGVVANRAQCFSGSKYNPIVMDSTTKKKHTFFFSPTGIDVIDVYGQNWSNLKINGDELECDGIRVQTIRKIVLHTLDTKWDTSNANTILGNIFGLTPNDVQLDTKMDYLTLSHFSRLDTEDMVNFYSNTQNTRDMVKKITTLYNHLSD